MGHAASAGITILHLSDPQFGAHHRFEKDGVDSLASRLIQDLDTLGEAVPRPDLVVLSGDITERGMKDEFATARAFVDDLLAHLRLDPDRLVVVPGNHDVNRKKCESYFNDCEGDGEEPVEPYAVKWRHYVDFVAGLHGAAAFTPERPYRLHTYDDLGIAVAALNSTMRESHREDDHYGWCGEEQLRWFAGKLARRPHLLRVGLVHHNVRADTATIDAECLRDAGNLAQLLEPNLDLVLHGHTHDGRHDRLPDGTLVLASGSAAVKPDQRPEEVGNQYQVLHIDAEGLTRWARRYDPGHNRWVGDTTISAGGGQWEERFDRPRLPGPPRTLERPGDDGYGRDEFADLFERVTRFWYGPDHHIEHRRTTGDPPLHYLVITGSEAVACGCLRGPADQAAVDEFDRAVHRPFRQLSPAVLSVLVHTGPPDPALTLAARQRGIRLTTWTEHQNLLDLSLYTAQLRDRLAADSQYPQDLYLPQRHRAVDRQGRTHDEVRPDLAGVLLSWLLGDEGGLVLVLGEAGYGKSFLVRRLAHLLLGGESGITPLVVLLRSQEKNHTVVEMASQTLAASNSEFRRERYEHMLRSGRIVLLVDGYDEFAIRVGHDRAADQLASFLGVATDRAKVVLTTRPSHFRSRQQATAKVFDDVVAHTRNRVVELEPFDGTEQRRFLERWFELKGTPQPAAAADRWMAALAGVDNLPELARTPRMLSFMARDLDVADIEAAGRQGQTITAAGLYERLVGTWLATEADRTGAPVAGRDERSRLAPDDRRRVAEELALALWRANAGEATQAMLEDVASRTLDLPKLGLSVTEACHEVASRTLLTGEADARRFAHQSIFEYLLACRLAADLRAGVPTRLGEAELSELTARFLRDLAPAEAERWIASLPGARRRG